MKKIIKLITLFIVISSTITSCLLDDKALTDGFNDGPNFTTFTNFTQNLSAVANGDEYTFPINLEVQGPTVIDMTGDVTATISVEGNSTAVEGVHYAFNSNTVTLMKSNNIYRRNSDYSIYRRACCSNVCRISFVNKFYIW